MRWKDYNIYVEKNSLWQFCFLFIMVAVSHYLFCTLLYDTLALPNLYIKHLYFPIYIQLHVSGTLPPTRSIHKTFDIQTHWLLADCCCPSLSCVYGMIAIWFDYKPCNTTIRTCQWRHNLLSYFFYLLYSSNLLPKTPKSAITPKYIMNKQSQYL